MATEPPQLQLLRGALEQYSPTYNETPAAEYFVDAMKTAGFDSSYIDTAGNAIGVWGEGDTTVMFLGHIDTVPGEIEVKLRKGVLWGRGACDAKGGMCAIIAAAQELDPGLKKELKLIVAGCVEEECATSKGAHQVLEDFSEPDYVINGEPSGWHALTIGYKGGVRFVYRLQQDNTHHASWEPSVNEHAFTVMRQIQEHIEAMDTPENSRFYAPYLEIRDWNSDDNGLSSLVEVKCNLRVPPEFDAEAFKKFVDTIETPGTFMYSEQLEGFETGRSSKLVREFLKAIRQQGGKPVFKKKTGSSDLGVVKTQWHNAEMLAYSPGDSKLDHTPDEHIVLEEYYASILILRDVLTSLAE